MRFQTVVAALLVATLAHAQTPPTPPTMPEPPSMPAPPSIPAPPSMPEPPKIPSPPVVEVPSGECLTCLNGAMKSVPACSKVDYIWGSLGNLPKDQKDCICALAASSTWVDTCKATCPAKMIEPSNLYNNDWTKSQCGAAAGGSFNLNSGSAGALAPKAGAAMALAAAAAHAFL